MKRFFILALALVVSASFLTVDAGKKDKKKKKAEAVQEVVEQPVAIVSSSDSVSYAAGVAMTNGLIPYLKQQYQFDEVFMDDFSVYGSSFDDCLSNLDRVLQRCKDTNLVLNWEKCHFMVNEGIVLGHKISEKGIEVDKAKVDAIEKMPCPTDIRGIRSFLGHAGFYRRFIKGFSKISRPLTNLL